MQRILVALALVAGVASSACGAVVTPAASPSPPAGHAELVDGPFRLTFDMPRTQWSAADPITATAALELVGVGGPTVSGSGSGLIGFEYLQVDGPHHVVPASTADCRPYRLEAGRPLSSALAKSGGFTDQDPDAAFLRAFFADPVVHLPAGRWQITAIAAFAEGADCTGPSHSIRVPITIEVTP